MARRAKDWLTAPGLGATQRSLTGSTWALDANGRAYNTPSVGTNLFTNSDFSSWTGDNPTGWSILNEDANNYITEDAAGARMVSNDTTVLSMRQTIGAANKVYRMEITATITSGQIRNRTLNIDSMFTRSIPGSPVVRAGISTGTPTPIIYRDTPGNTDMIYTDAKFREVTLSETLAYTRADTGNPTVSARIYSSGGTTGSIAGIFCGMDDPTNPQNFVIGLVNDEIALLYKCVAGTFSALINTSASLVQDAELEIRRPSGNTFQLWYNGSQVGSDQTINDAAIANNTQPYCGAFSPYYGDKFTSFSLNGVGYKFP